MFIFIVIAVLALGGIPLFRTIRQQGKLGTEEKVRRYKRGAAVLLGVIAAVIIFAVLARFLTELYWFRRLNFSERYLSAFTLRLLLFFAAAAVTFSAVFFNFYRYFSNIKIERKGPAAMAVSIPLSIIFGLWIQSGWQKVLFFINRTGGGSSDPVLALPDSFYLFSLPFYNFLLTALLTLISFIIAGIFFSYLKLGRGLEAGDSVPLSPARHVLRHILVLTGILFLLVSVHNLLGIPRLLTSSTGLISGVTFLDDKLRIPVLYGISGLYFAGALFLFFSAGVQRFRNKIFSLNTGDKTAVFPATKRSFIFPAVFFGIIIVSKLIVPGIVSAVVVKPNELEVEKPYIDHHINMTQKAYKLGAENVSRNRFSAGTNITAALLESNRPTLNNVRLWDWRALTSNLQEQQEIRLYYQFEDVDVDRYTLNDGYTQMMITGRELEKSELERKSKTWVSEKLKYTHGYGLVMLPAHQYQKQGNPKLFVKNIPSEVEKPSLQVEQPQIYFGERTNDHVYVKTEEEEFDYPGEKQSEYTQYAGDGGVRLSSFFREFLYAWRFDGHRLLFSGYITRESRILYRRNIRERVKRLAPFLLYDKDPYLVLTESGDLQYILDAYSISSEYPYAERYTGKIEYYNGINYIRNSVKVTVDAYDGSVRFYVIDEEDPLIQTYRNAFPDLFEPFGEMPEDLQKHIRYPEEYFTIQARMFATYHMENTAIFYQKEDVWEFSTERYRDNFQDVEPYYVMVNFPGEEEIEFVLMLPFTPKNKNVMNAWIAGRCDLPNYGELMVYTIPKGVELLGPRQIEARIDQDTGISRAMTLWGQRGSEVIRGNLLAIPLFNKEELYILYVEPIYLQAENANLPQIKRIAVADQDKVAWSIQFADALSKLAGEPVLDAEASAEAATAAAAPAAEGVPAPAGTVPAETLKKLNSLLKEYNSAAGEGNYAEAGRKLEEMKNILEERRTQ